MRAQDGRTDGRTECVVRPASGRVALTGAKDLIAARASWREHLFVACGAVELIVLERERLVDQRRRTRAALEALVMPVFVSVRQVLQYTDNELSQRAGSTLTSPRPGGGRFTHTSVPCVKKIVGGRFGSKPAGPIAGGWILGKEGSEPPEAPPQLRVCSKLPE